MSTESTKSVPAQKSAKSNGVGRMVSFAALLLIILVIGFFFFRVMAGFFLPLFIAALLAVVCSPFHLWLQQIFPKSPAISACIATLAVFLLIMAPVSFALTLAIGEGVEIAYSDWSVIPGRLDKFRESFGLVIPYQAELDLLNQHLSELPIAPDQELPSLPNLENALKRVSEDVANVRKHFLQVGPGGDTVLPQGVHRDQWMAAEFQLKQLEEVVQETQVLVSNVVRDGGGLTGDAEAGIRDGLQVGFVRGSKFRQAMLGGLPWSTLVEVANPSQAQINLWKQQMGRTFQGWLVKLTGQTTALIANLVFGLGISMISLFYFFLDGPRMIVAVMHLSPLEDRYERELSSEFAKVSRAVVLAMLVSAVVQGILAGLGFYFAGFEPLFLMVILTTVLALVPFVGTAAVWLPACLWLGIYEQRMLAAFFLFIYCASIVSMIDNVIKPLILQGQSNIHPLLGLLSILGGIQAMGPVGILIGPMLVAFLQALLNILQKEMRSLETA